MAPGVEAPKKNVLNFRDVESHPVEFKYSGFQYTGMAELSEPILSPLPC